MLKACIQLLRGHIQSFEVGHLPKNSNNQSRDQNAGFFETCFTGETHSEVRRCSVIHSGLPDSIWFLFQRNIVKEAISLYNLKVGCLHPVACTRLGSGFPSNATLVSIFYSITATCFGRMTIFRWKYIYFCMLHDWLAFIILKLVVCYLLRVLIFYSITATCFGRMTIFRWKPYDRNT
jgi:hypothetical protein